MILHQKFGEWTLMKTEHVRKTPKNKYYLVQCSCGTFSEVIGTFLKNGTSTRCKSCGQKRFHDKYINPPDKPFKYRGNSTNNTWRAMIQRCTNPTNNRYYCYGGRGISVCDRWLESFKNFLDDMGERPKGMQLDRIDTNGNYTKENCRWVTVRENCNNRNLRSALTIGDKFFKWQVEAHDLSKKIQHYFCRCECRYLKSIRMSTLKSGINPRCFSCAKNKKNNNQLKISDFERA